MLSPNKICVALENKQMTGKLRHISALHPAGYVCISARQTKPVPGEVALDTALSRLHLILVY